MKKIVYLFNTKAEAKTFIDKINAGEGIPVSKESTTQTYCQYQEWNDKFYVELDNVIKKYGEGHDEVEIEIEIEPPFESITEEQ
jgi:hypothetical protein